MSSGIPGRHPDQDLLADLAAEVLPHDEARLVEAHVIGCAQCAELLGDAERMRRLLKVADPGPMPVEVFLRIQGALAAQATGGNGAAEPALLASSAEIDGAPTAAWVRFTDEEEPPSRRDGHRTGPEVLPAPRGTRGPTRSRRDVRGEDRFQDRLSRLGNHRTAMAVAAGSVAVLALGVAVNSVRDTGASTTDAAASLSAQGAAAAPIGTSGLNYTSAQLQVQTRALLRTPVRIAASDSAVPSSGGTVSASASPSAAGSQAPGNTSLRDPAKLQACLTALGADRRPVAVDLARFEGREAAIIVVPNGTGGYDVWAVARDCRPGEEGTLKFQTIAP